VDVEGTVGLDCVKVVVGTWLSGVDAEVTVAGKEKSLVVVKG